MKTITFLLFLLCFNSLFAQNFAEAVTLVSTDNLGSNRKAFLADINGDGYDDLVCGPHINIYYGNETGYFSDYETITDITPPRTTADLNGDGKTDIIGYIRWLFSTENGAYEITDNHPEGDHFPMDFDLDGDIDVLTMAVWLSIRPLIIKENIGTNDFENHSIETKYYNGAFAEDINADGYPDIGVLYDSTIVKLHYNQAIAGEIEFEATTFDLSEGTPELKYIDLKYRDVDNDGLSDVICIGNGSYFRWLKNNGNGEYSLQNAVILDSDLPEGVTVASFDIVDFNFDGLNDLTVYFNTSEATGEVHLFYANQSVTSFATGENILPVNRHYFYDRDNILPYDYDKDGNIDLLVRTNGKLIFLKNELSVAVRETDVPTDFKIAPNPFSEVLTVSSEKYAGKTLDLSLFDLQGRKIFTQKITLPGTVDLSAIDYKGALQIVMQEAEKPVVTETLFRY